MADDGTRFPPNLADEDRAVLDQLYPVLVQELHDLAASFLAGERGDHTLQPTALVNESYVRLVDGQTFRVNDRKHVIAVAAQAMRRVLVDHARRHQADKRGGDRHRVTVLTDELVSADAGEPPLDYLALHEALEKLESIDPLTVRVVELRYLGGLTIDEAAGVLGVSASSVEREWRFARAWLRDQLAER